MAVYPPPSIYNIFNPVDYPTVITSNLDVNNIDALTINLAEGGAYRINNVAVLSSADLGVNVVNSSLTSIGTQTSGVNIASGQSYKINNTSVLDNTTLGSSIVNSSLTSIGTQTAGVNIASGQSYKINNTSVLDNTTLGSSIVNSSLTSIGTQTTGVNIASGQSYKINNTSILDNTTLGSSVITSSLTSIGTTTTSTLYYYRGTGTLSNTSVSRTAIKLSNDAGASSMIFEKYSFSLPSGTTQIILPLSFYTSNILFCCRSDNRSHLISASIYTTGTTVTSLCVVNARIVILSPTMSIQTINTITSPAITLSWTTALTATTTFRVFNYYFTE